MTQLSPHFDLEEFTRSDAANAIGDPNTPTPDALKNLETTAAGMELVRAACGNSVIFISSGYRNPAVNASVGGVKDSAHALGYACDFVVRGLSSVLAAARIQNAGIKFDQLIHESGRGILHISFDPQNRGQVLTQAGPAGTPVTKGIG